MTTLAEFILRDMEAILAEWETFARSIPAAQGMDSLELRDHASKMLRAIALDLEQPQSARQQAAKSKGDAPEPAGGEETAATSHGTDRHNEGFDLNALVSEYRALRATVTRLWSPEEGSSDREMQLARFHEAIDQALAESVVRYSAEVTRARDLFIGVLSHDLRTPIGVTLLSAQYLLQSQGLSGDQLKAVTTILSSTTSIQQMTADLMDVARARMGGTLPLDRKPMDLARVCRHVALEAQALHPDRTVALAATGDLLGTWDETRVYQLLSNLVENACRHGTGENPVDIAASGDAEKVRIVIHNDGAPIPKADLQRIFEPMKQTESGASRAEGLGLGLYIARAITDAHQGDLRVESSRERGTTFTVCLPRDQGRPRPVGTA